MKTFYKTLFGITSAIIVLSIINLIFYILNMETNKCEFLIGWISCIGFNVGFDIYELFHS